MRLGFAQGSDERLTKPSLRRHPRTPLSRLHAIRARFPPPWSVATRPTPSELSVVNSRTWHHFNRYMR